jgi:hypothetical protein
MIKFKYKKITSEKCRKIMGLIVKLALIGLSHISFNISLSKGFAGAIPWRFVCRGFGC